MSHSIPNYNNSGHQSRAASSSSIHSQIPPPLNGLSSTKRDSINSISSRVPSAGGGGVAPQSSLHQQLFQRPDSRVEDGILDRPLNRTRGAEVGMATWAFLFAEIVSYSQSRSDSVDDLEKRLSRLGYEAGTRILSLLLLRNTQSSGMKDPRREHRLIPALQFVHTQVYKYIFGQPADGLERSVEGEDEYMLTLNQPPLTQHVSVPKDMSQLSVEAYTAGLVEGVLDGLNLPARVTAHTVGTDQFPQRTVILIKLDPSVMDREAVLGK